jgi:hypothetical protein
MFGVAPLATELPNEMPTFELSDHQPNVILCCRLNNISWRRMFANYYTRIRRPAVLCCPSTRMSVHPHVCLLPRRMAVILRLPQVQCCTRTHTTRFAMQILAADPTCQDGLLRCQL